MVEGSKNVLLVDDEEYFLEYLADALSVFKNHFNVRTAPNGADAVKVLKSAPFDLVITDLSMPKMDGFELVTYIKRNFPKIPVIFMTCFGTPKIEKIMRDMGVFHYIEKPIDFLMAILIAGRHYRPQAMATYFDELAKYIALAMDINFKKTDLMKARENILRGKIIKGTKEPRSIKHDDLGMFNAMKKLAEGGSADNQFAVGIWYYAGDIINKNDKEAAMWFTRAVLKGHVEAKLYLGHMYLRGDGIDVDKRKGLKLIADAAESGNANAQFYLAWMYKNGDEVDRDLGAALRWFKKAGAQGHEKAEYNAKELQKLMSNSNNTNHLR